MSYTETYGPFINNDQEGVDGKMGGAKAGAGAKTIYLWEWGREGWGLWNILPAREWGLKIFWNQTMDVLKLFCKITHINGNNGLLKIKTLLAQDPCLYKSFWHQFAVSIFHHRCITCMICFPINIAALILNKLFSLARNLDCHSKSQTSLLNSSQDNIK